MEDENKNVAMQQHRLTHSHRKLVSYKFSLHPIDFFSLSSETSHLPPPPPSALSLFCSGCPFVSFVLLLISIQTCNVDSKVFCFTSSMLFPEYTISFLYFQSCAISLNFFCFCVRLVRLFHFEKLFFARFHLCMNISILLYSSLSYPLSLSIILLAISSSYSNGVKNVVFVCVCSIRIYLKQPFKTLYKVSIEKFQDL